MNAQLQVVAQGLEVVTNKVAYMEAKQEDSDYSGSEGEEGEEEELVRDANKFFIGESGVGEEPKGRGRRRAAGNAASIVKGVRKR